MIKIQNSKSYLVIQITSNTNCNLYLYFLNKKYELMIVVEPFPPSILVLNEE